MPQSINHKDPHTAAEHERLEEHATQSAANYAILVDVPMTVTMWRGKFGNCGEKIKTTHQFLNFFWPQWMISIGTVLQEYLKSKRKMTKSSQHKICVS